LEFFIQYPLFEIQKNPSALCRQAVTGRVAGNYGNQFSVLEIRAQKNRTGKSWAAGFSFCFSGALPPAYWNHTKKRDLNRLKKSRFTKKYLWRSPLFAVILCCQNLLVNMKKPPEISRRLLIVPPLYVHRLRENGLRSKKAFGGFQGGF
jgi:hypothetical protein